MHFEFWIPKFNNSINVARNVWCFMLQRFFGLSSIPKLWDSQHRQLFFFGRRLFFITSRALDYTSLYLRKKAVYDVIHEGGTTRGSDNEGVALVYVESSASYDCHGAPRARGKEGLQQTGRRQTSPPRFRKGPNQTSFSI